MGVELRFEWVREERRIPTRRFRGREQVVAGNSAIGQSSSRDYGQEIAFLTVFQRSVARSPETNASSANVCLFAPVARPIHI